MAGNEEVHELAAKDVAAVDATVHTSDISETIDAVQTLPCGTKRARSRVSGDAARVTCTGCLEALGDN